MSSRYSDISKKLAERGTEYLVPVLYPEVEVTEDDIYVISTEGDRYDKLSLEFYGQVDYWWVILAANPRTTTGDSLGIQPGLQIRIPAEPADYLVQFRNLNS